MTDSQEEEREGISEKNTFTIAGYDSFNNYVTEGYKVIMEGVKASGNLPSGRNYHFYQTYTNFRDKIREKFGEIQDIMEDILRHQEIKNGVRDVMMEDAMDTMISLNDKMLDRATKYMDVMEGIKTGFGNLVQEVSGSWNKAKKVDKNAFSLSTKRNIPRPQFTFKDKPDNNNTIWEPKIKEKPNALKPLAILLERSPDGDECFSHPYEYELELFSVPDNQLKRKKNIKKPLPLEQTPLELVQTEVQLQDLISYLNSQPAFAVDLENHSYRSFLGFTCLIQISTREKDFIIDTLVLRHSLHALNEVFTKPTILKVFHGADQDIIWLQRDFSVYVVNMFDTYQAARLLNYPKLSLAFLLNLYCKVDANKHFQLFDWRTRPLPDVAIKYAREDTHYLLYIADMMSLQLLDKANGNINILKASYEQSKQVCMKRFSKLVVEEETYMTVFRKSKRYFDNRQLFALKALYLWRDKTARELDESLAYVLPDSMMLNIAENLPREVQGILACCNPVPPLVKANLIEIHYLLIRAKEQPLVKVISETSSQATSHKVGNLSEEQMLLEEWYHPSAERRDDLPTLLGDNPSPDDETNQDPDNESESKSNCQPSLTLFNEKEQWYSTSDNKEVELDTQVLNRLKGLNFISPYQRYVQVLPYAAQIEKERREQEAKLARDHQQQSREQQAMAMKIKSLQESGLIKLKKEDENVNTESLKIQLLAERKRRVENNHNEVSNKIRRKQNRNNQRKQKDGSVEEIIDCEDSPPSLDVHDLTSDVQPELRGVNIDVPVVCDSKNLDENLDEVHVKNETVKTENNEEPESDQTPVSWKDLKRQKQPGTFKPFDYSQVDFNRRFGGNVKKQIKNNASTSSLLDKKRKWKNNPGAQKFAKKKRKRNPVV